MKLKSLPKKIIWREALRQLTIGEYFEAPLLQRGNIACQITSLKSKEESRYTTSKISEDTITVTRIK